MSRAMPRIRRRRLPVLLAALLAYGLLAAGCTRLQVVRPLPGGRWEEVPGFTFYGSKPYLLIYPLEGRPGTAWRIVYLVDPSQSYSVALKGWFGTRSYRLELSEAGTLRSVTAGAQGRSAPVEPALSSALAQQIQAALAGQVSSAPLGDLSLPEPGLYELVFNQVTRDHLDALRRVSFEGSPQTALSPRVREIRFETARGRPEVVSTIVLALDRPLEGSENLCPPPGIGLSVFQDESVIGLCGSPLDCRASGLEVRCEVTARGYHHYLVRAGGPASTGLQRVDLGIESRFPASPEGFAPFEPAADIRFGAASDGKIRTVAVHYDPRRGSCVLRRDFGEIEILVNGERKDLPRSNQPPEGECLLGWTATLSSPADDVSVTVVPKNAAGLVGKMAFAASAAPWREAATQREPPIVVHVGAYASGGGARAEDGKLVELPVGSGYSDEETETSLLDVEGQLTGLSFTSFEVEFDAAEQTARRRIEVLGWSTGIPEDQEQEKAVINFAQKPCPCGKASPWLPLPVRVTAPHSKGEKHNSIRFFVPSHEKPRRLCFEVRFQRKDRKDCHSIQVDEFLLESPNRRPNPKSPETKGEPG